MWYYQLVILVCLFGISTTAPNKKCRPIEIPECKKLGYNETRTVPGLYLRTRLSEIKAYITFLDKTNCSDNLLFFLCTMYSPMCFTGYDRIFPCRSVCLDVKDKCSKVLKMIDEKWPTELACHKLPEHNTDMCIQPNAIVAKTDNGYNNTSVQPTIKKEERCPRCKRDNRRIRYKQYERADYVIKATFRQRVTTATGETKILIEIKDRLKRGSFRFGRGKYHLVSYSKCLCNPMVLDETYFILGKEDKINKTLLFNKKTHVQLASEKWEPRFLKWKKRSRAERKASKSNAKKSNKVKGQGKKSTRTRKD